MFAYIRSDNLPDTTSRIRLICDIICNVASRSVATRTERDGLICLSATSGQVMNSFLRHLYLHVLIEILIE
jgi:hypothetical protein